jgi:site-specific DNA-methyltransferase (adenine-specific)
MGFAGGLGRVTAEHAVPGGIMLPALPENSVHLILGAMPDASGAGGWRAGADWLRVLKPGASAFLIAGRRHANPCALALEDIGFALKDYLAWRAPATRTLRPRLTPILWLAKPPLAGPVALEGDVSSFDEVGFRRLGGNVGRVIDCAFAPGDALFAEKPMGLMRGLIALATREGQVVLDPFEADGPVSRAAASLNRRFVSASSHP